MTTAPTVNKTPVRATDLASDVMKTVVNNARALAEQLRRSYLLATDTRYAVRHPPPVRRLRQSGRPGCRRTPRRTRPPSRRSSRRSDDPDGGDGRRGVVRLWIGDKTIEGKTRLERWSS
jgi:hypothetical protein